MTSRIILSPDKDGAFPANIRGALFVLEDLGLGEHPTALRDIIDATLIVDPLHLCRMARNGLFQDIPRLHSGGMRVLGASVAIPVITDTQEDQPTILVSMATNDISIHHPRWDAQAPQTVAARELFEWLSPVPKGKERAQALIRYFAALTAITLQETEEVTPLHGRVVKMLVDNG